LLEIEVLSIKRGATELKMWKYYFAQIEKARIGEGEIEGGRKRKRKFSTRIHEMEREKEKGFKLLLLSTSR